VLEPEEPDDPDELEPPELEPPELDEPDPDEPAELSVLVVDDSELLLSELLEGAVLLDEPLRLSVR
jgi:hypothetical protein